LIISWNITIEHSEFPAKHLLPHLFFADCDQKTQSSTYSDPGFGVVSY